MRTVVVSQKPWAQRIREEAAAPGHNFERVRADLRKVTRERDAAENSIGVAQAMLDDLIRKMRRRAITYEDAIDTLEAIRKGPLK